MVRHAFVLLGAAVLLLGFRVPLSAGSPATFEVRWERPGPLFRGVPVSLEIVALDAEGRVVEDCAGSVTIEGATREGRALEAPLRLERGAATLSGVEVPSGELRVSDGKARGVGSRRVLPGWLTLLPAIVAIALAVGLKQVLPALFCGVWVGVLLLEDFALVSSLLRTADTYCVGALADRDHASIIMFSLTLAGVVGIITRIGGFRGVVEVISRLARGPRSGQVATWLLGTMVFFDDYASVLIVGNSMRPFTDRVRVSREKLSFIVDATAAPVATIGIISTWTAYQLGVIGDILPAITAVTDRPYVFFIRSIPASFYSFLMLFFVFLNAVSLRDFGPMRAAEERCRRTGEVLREGSQPLLDPSLDKMGDVAGVVPRWQNAAIPILCVIVFTLLGLVATGRAALSPAERAGAGLQEIIARADAYRSLLWAGLGASLVAGALAILQGYRLGVVMDSWVSGARSLVIAAIILILAWSISAVSKELHTGAYVASLTSGILSPTLVPALAFVVAGAISFATGTSYGTMGILIPILLPIAYRLSLSSGLDPIVMERIGTGTLAAILCGSVFGDHCSPISDTTVMSSMAAGADHIDHVRTQLPYAVLVALLCIPCYLLVGRGAPPLLVLPLGLALVAAAFFWQARRVG
jgi:Na+/H+ antiporter NhaC